MRTKLFIPTVRKQELGFYAILSVLEKDGNLTIEQVRRILSTTSRNLKGIRGDKLYEQAKSLLVAVKRAEEIRCNPIREKP